MVVLHVVLVVDSCVKLVIDIAGVFRLLDHGEGERETLKPST